MHFEKCVWIILVQKSVASVLKYAILKNAFGKDLNLDLKD